MFKSTVIERRDVWFADDGPLSIKLCEDAEDSGECCVKLNYTFDMI